MTTSDERETRTREEDACDERDTAWSFALGSLDDSDDAAFRAHLFEGCADCGRTLVEARAVLADLDLLLARRTLEQGHGAGVGRDLIERLTAELRPSAAAPPTAFAAHVADNAPPALLPTELAGISVADAGAEEAWRPTAVAGVEFKTLVTDMERRRATALVRMAPGSSYPAHRHASREECYVAQGDLSFGEERMGAGDYIVAERDSVHPVQSTRHGCVLLIVSSLDDEPV